MDFGAGLGLEGFWREEVSMGQIVREGSLAGVEVAGVGGGTGGDGMDAVEEGRELQSVPAADFDR